MHTDRTADGPTPGSQAYRAQRTVLLELIVDPPPSGEPVRDLARRLDLSVEDVTAAVTELAALGLAAQHGDFVVASAAALRFEALALVRA